MNKLNNELNRLDTFLLKLDKSNLGVSEQGWV
jgi:hypothetical protein